MKTHTQIVQLSPEWFELKVGKLSGSQIQPLMAVKGLGAGARTLAVQLLAERITGEITETPTTFAMQHGIETEPIAREIYAASRGVDVVEVGGIENNGCFYSPDGLVGDDGLIEIKCRSNKNHLEFLLHGEIPKEAYNQMQFGLYMSDRKWCDYIEFNPSLPDHMASKVVRVERDEEAIEIIETRLIQFENLINNYKKKLK